MVDKKYMKYTLRIPVEGDMSLLYYHGSSSQSPSSINYMSVTLQGQEIHFNYQIPANQLENIEGLFTVDISGYEFNTKILKSEIETYNKTLHGFISPLLDEREKEVSRNKSMISSIKIPIKRRTDVSHTYDIPEIRRKIDIKNISPKATVAEPTLPVVEYEYILKVMKSMAFAMERSPTTFMSLNEPQIRDFFLISLNGHYEGNATGETFNGAGKTDILIRYKDQNAFIAECLMWKGAEYLSEKITQLFGYITWRDTKTAINIFSTNKDLSGILDKIKEVMESHPNFKSKIKLQSVELQTETIFCYEFLHPTDKGKSILLTVMAFQIFKV